MKLFLDVIQFLHNLMQQLPYIENNDLLYFLDLLFLLFYPVSRINIRTTISKTSVTFTIRQLDRIEIESVPLIDKTLILHYWSLRALQLS